MKKANIPFTEAEATELSALLGKVISQEVSKRRARILRAILNKLDHAVFLDD